jgi:hypothetical protein
MFRIQNNASTVAPLASRLSQVRFDTRHPAHHPRTPASTPGQMAIVGRPTPTESHKAELAQVRQTNQSVAAAATVAQVAEQGITSVQVTLHELYQLSARAESADLTPAERQVLLEDVRRLLAELRDTVASTRFNGIPLLNGAQQALTFQLGNGYQATDVHLGLMDARPEALLPGVAPEAFADPAFTRSLTEVLKQAIQAGQERLEKTIAFRERLGAALEHLQDVPRHISDADLLREAEDVQGAMMHVRSLILTQPAAAVLAQAAALDHSAMALIGP